MPGSILGDNLTLLGTLATVCTGLATGVGALPILFVRRISDRLLDAMLGFAAGVMLAATAFSLIIPAIELGGVWITIVGLLIGAAFLSLLDKVLPHEHLHGARGAGIRLAPRLAVDHRHHFA